MYFDRFIGYTETAKRRYIHFLNVTRERGGSGHRYRRADPSDGVFEEHNNGFRALSSTN